MADGNGFLDFGHELVVDLFAGGGGASLGLADAYRHPDIAINHSPVAIAVHEANHPATKHYTCDVFEVDPLEATQGRPVGVLWASPDCRHHSKAKGGKPRSKKIRGLAWVVVKWAAAVRPRVILLENVEEFQDWGPLDRNGQPRPDGKGKTFQHWAARLRNLGYRIEWRELVAADYDTPTIRKRLYVVARCDGRPIVWPKPQTPKAMWRTAAECIDWSIPGRSIFRDKPLAANTERRIAKGLWRHVINTDTPFIVPLRGTSESHTSTHDLSQPLSTITGGGTHHALVAPCLTEFANASNQRTFAANEPLRTQVAQVKGGHFALVAGTMVQIGYGEREGQAPRCLDLQKPLGTVVAGGVKHAVVAACFEQANGGWYDGDGRSANDPLSSVCTSGANQRLVSAYFVKWYGNERDGVSARDPMHTVTTKDRLGLVQAVQVARDALTDDQWAGAKRCADFLHKYLPEHFPEPFDLLVCGDKVLVDISLRMLVPRELARAQGFPDTYCLDKHHDGAPITYLDPITGKRKRITQADQVRLIGNSVCRKVAAAIARANLADLIAQYERMAA